jgi:CheY-like chemotaxis protein
VQLQSQLKCQMQLRPSIQMTVIIIQWGTLVMRILIVEDDRKMAGILQEALEKQFHRIVLAFTGIDGLDVARSHQFEAIILDAMLPGIDGYSVARSLRESQIATPIVMLTARDATSDIVKGLDAEWMIILQSPLHSRSSSRDSGRSVADLLPRHPCFCRSRIYPWTRLRTPHLARAEVSF